MVRCAVRVRSREKLGADSWNSRGRPAAPQLEPLRGDAPGVPPQDAAPPRAGRQQQPPLGWLPAAHLVPAQRQVHGPAVQRPVRAGAASALRQAAGRHLPQRQPLRLRAAGQPGQLAGVCVRAGQPACAAASRAAWAAWRARWPSWWRSTRASAPASRRSWAGCASSRCWTSAPTSCRGCCRSPWPACTACSSSTWRATSCGATSPRASARCPHSTTSPTRTTTSAPSLAAASTTARTASPPGSRGESATL